MSQRGSRRTSRSSSSSSSSSTSAPPIAETTSTSFVGDADLDNLDISSHIQFMDVERDLLHRDFQKETERVMSLLVPLTRNIKNLEVFFSSCFKPKRGSISLFFFVFVFVHVLVFNNPHSSLFHF